MPADIYRSEIMEVPVSIPRMEVCSTGQNQPYFNALHSTCMRARDLCMYFNALGTFSTFASLALGFVPAPLKRIPPPVQMYVERLDLQTRRLGTLTCS